LQIDVLDHVAGARAARGVAVIIDVFRAFSVAPYVVAAGAARLLPVAEIEEAFALRTSFPGAVLVGERHARKLPGFDAGNSPAEMLAIDLRGKVVVHTTHAGTQGLIHAENAGEVLTGSFVNISAVCRHVLSRTPERVTLVRMGHEARARCDEDDLYAESLERMLRGGAAPVTQSVRERLRDSPAAQKFFDPRCDWAPEADFDLCTDVDRFDFVLQLRRAADGPRELRRIVPGERP